MTTTASSQPSDNSPAQSSGGRYERLIQWRQMHLTDSGFILMLALVVGVLSGIGAALLKYMIGAITTLVTRGVHAAGLPWLIVGIPVIGIALAAIFSRYILRARVDNGVERMVGDLRQQQYALSGKTIWGSLIASALTLGFGGTAGSEGPIAYTGAGIGSKLGQIFKVQPRMLMILLGCGAAAGIAGIFKAPIGGALFAIEVLRVELSTVAILGVFLATLTASLVAYCLSGCTLDINVISPGAFDNATIPWAILLGVVCGIYSLYYMRTGGITRRYLRRPRATWINWLTSGLMIGLMVYLFPSMYGEGYGTITDIINSNAATLTTDGIIDHWHGSPWLLISACAGILLLKGIGSAATNNGGGVAGDFAPTLFAGCILGLMYASILRLTGWADINSAHYALIAMAGAMSGIIRAPLMAIFLVTEMVGGVEFLLPAAIVALISYSIVMIFKRDTFYHSRPFAAPVNQ